MNGLLLLVVLMVGPEPVAVVEHIDCLETNNFYDTDGRLVFRQRLHWRWNGRESRYQCEAWRMIKDEGNYPVGNSLTWVDDGCVIRKVLVTSKQESWTQYDPELIDRARLPKESRTELTTPPTLRRAKQLAKETTHAD
jgi:hypothetical protein